MSKIERLTRLAKERHFASGEQPVAVVMGMCESVIKGKKVAREGIFLAAGDRLIFFTTGIFSEASEVFPLATISSVEVGKTMLGHHFRLKIPAGDVEMKWIQKGDVGPFLAFLQRNVGIRQEAVAPITGGRSPEPSATGAQAMPLAAEAASAVAPASARYVATTTGSTIDGARSWVERLLRKLILSGVVAIGCLFLFAFIGMSNSATVGWPALALAASCVAALATGKPPQVVRALRGQKSVAFSILLATAFGGLAAILGANADAEKVAAAKEAEQRAAAVREAADAARSQRRSELETKAPPVREKLLALAKSGHDAAASDEWNKAAELAKEADALTEPYREYEIEQALGEDARVQLSALKTKVSEHEKREKAAVTNTLLADLVAKAQKAKSSGMWTDAKAAIDDAVEAQRSYEQIGRTEDLEPRLVQRTATLATEIGTRVEQERAAAEAKGAATAKADELQRALEQARQLTEESRWADADEALVNLTKAINAVDPALKQHFPRGFSLDRIRKQVDRLHGQVRPKAAYIAICGTKPVCGGWDGECVGLESAVRRTAHDPDSIDVENCTNPVLTTKACWVTKCEVRGKNAFGALILNRVTFSMSTLGVEQL